MLVHGRTRRMDDRDSDNDPAPDLRAVLCELAIHYPEQLITQVVPSSYCGLNDSVTERWFRAGGVFCMERGQYIPVGLTAASTRPTSMQKTPPDRSCSVNQLFQSQ